MIHQAAENCKKRFGQEDPVEMCCAVDGQEKRLVLSHKEYERLCGPLLERLRKPLQRSIADAHVRLSDIDEVVLVGGATRMPVVRDFVVKLFHKFPDVTVHPDEAVALGAAVQGAMKSRNRDQEENRLLLLKGEQCYEESTGEARERIERCMRAFEAALDGRDRNQILETGQMLRECIAKTGL